MSLQSRRLRETGADTRPAPLAGVPRLPLAAQIKRPWRSDSRHGRTCGATHGNNNKSLAQKTSTNLSQKIQRVRRQPGSHRRPGGEEVRIHPRPRGSRRVPAPGCSPLRTEVQPQTPARNPGPPRRAPLPLPLQGAAAWIHRGRPEHGRRAPGGARAPEVDRSRRPREGGSRAERRRVDRRISRKGERECKSTKESPKPW